MAGLAVVGAGLSPAIKALADEEFELAGPHSPLMQGGGKKRLAMVVDPAKCAVAGDCTDCITACNTAHNVPQILDPNHEIKWIWEEDYEHAFATVGESEFATGGLKELPIVVMCNHCGNPPCTRVCPTQATWKRESDGIVMYDMHRCIGCRFCMAACPFGARSFNFEDPRPYIQSQTTDFPTRTKGVVEKCNFCEERLARGEIPACVEACKQQALAFGDLEDPNSEVRKLLAEHYTVRRKPQLGTQPQVYYIVS